MRRRTNFSLAFIFALVAFVGLANATEAEAPKEALKIIPASFYQLEPYDIVYGKEDAPIIVLEYYSLTCPHCAQFYLSSFQDLKKEYIDSGKVRWIKRSLVMDLQSMKGTLLLGCVKAESRENYLKILLTKQSSWAYQRNFINVLANIASLGGMSNKSFQACMNDDEQEHIIRGISIKASHEAKISGTPTFYVNAEKLTVFSEKSFKDRFNDILKK